MRNRFAVAVFGAIACASALPREGSEPVVSPEADSREAGIDQGDQAVMIALATSSRGARVGGTEAWRIYSRNSSNLVLSGRAGDSAVVEMRGRQLVAVRSNGSVTSRFAGPFLVRSPNPGTFVKHGGKRYRGELIITPTDSGMLVINRLGVESYLRGVVPLEIGNRQPGEQAAVEAQAVAARSYSYIRMNRTDNRPFHMYSSVQDQAYGGVDAEKPMSDAAVVATKDMVLRYAGRIVSTPYSSTCGGSTAAVQEVWWREPSQPYLMPVSDKIPGSDKFYCDPSPRFRWTSTFAKSDLRATLEKYLAQVSGGREMSVAPTTGGQRTSLGPVTSIRVEGRTPSDRVATLVIREGSNNHVIRGNDIRFLLRTPSGTILNSTYFTAETATDGSGEVSTLTLRGGGYGHGIGMCQWGAIGRARAGQDYRTILTTYYPGTTVSSI
ncbi:MAG TPA: SpoIID/LytB domain-containing protein [Gemmatimonadaceae bacterium]|nr:SpoIID/LytB domain-containing protein [Gemmatimonadaceae bacterium]